MSCQSELLLPQWKPVCTVNTSLSVRISGEARQGKKTGREPAYIYAQTTTGGEVWYLGGMASAQPASDHTGLCLCVQAELLLFAPFSLLGTQDQAGLPQGKNLHLHTPRIRLYLFLKVSLNLFKLIIKIQVFETALCLLPALLHQSEIEWESSPCLRTASRTF